MDVNTKHVLQSIIYHHTCSKFCCIIEDFGSFIIQQNLVQEKIIMQKNNKGCWITVAPLNHEPVHKHSHAHTYLKGHISSTVVHNCVSLSSYHSDSPRPSDRRGHCVWIQKKRGQCILV